MRVAAQGKVEVPVARGEQAIGCMHQQDAHAVSRIEHLAARCPTNGIVQPHDAHVVVRHW